MTDTKKPDDAKKPEQKKTGDPFDALMHEGEQMDSAMEGEFMGSGEQANEKQLPPTKDIVSQLLGVTFNGILAPRRGDHWKMNGQECDALGEAYGAVIDKYFPDMGFGVEAVAIMATVTIIGPRMAMDVAEQKRRQATQEAEHAGQD